MRTKALKEEYFENAQRAVDTARELEYLIKQKKRYALKEHLSAYECVYDEIVNVKAKLERLWERQIELYFLINE